MPPSSPHTSRQLNGPAHQNTRAAPRDGRLRSAYRRCLLLRIAGAPVVRAARLGRRRRRDAEDHRGARQGRRHVRGAQQRHRRRRRQEPGRRREGRRSPAPASPASGQAGFELLDKQKLGATDFQQKVNYQRALEGEIARTVEGVEGVRRPGEPRAGRRAALPGRPAARPAAMLLQTDAGMEPGAARGIASLVTSSVKGLKSENVSITDRPARSCGPRRRRGRRRGVAEAAGRAALLAAIEARAQRAARPDARPRQGPGPGQRRPERGQDLARRASPTTRRARRSRRRPRTRSSRAAARRRRRRGHRRATSRPTPQGAAGSGGTPTTAKTEGTDLGVGKTRRAHRGRARRASTQLERRAASSTRRSRPPTSPSLSRRSRGAAGLDTKRGDTINVSQVAVREGRRARRPSRSPPAPCSASPSGSCSASRCSSSSSSSAAACKQAARRALASSRPGCARSRSRADRRARGGDAACSRRRATRRDQAGDVSSVPSRSPGRSCLLKQREPETRGQPGHSSGWRERLGCSRCELARARPRRPTAAARREQGRDPARRARRRARGRGLPAPRARTRSRRCRSRWRSSSRSPPRRRAELRRDRRDRPAPRTSSPRAASASPARSLERALGAESAAEIIGRLSATIETRPFEFLRRTPPDQICDFLQNEHPQTIALVIANLPAASPRQVLAHCRPEQQAEVAVRIATMERDLARGRQGGRAVLEAKLSSVISQEYAAAGGVKPLADILNSADRAHRAQRARRLAETRRRARRRGPRR